MSKARAKLFALADLVRGSGDDTAVVLEQRGGGEGVALVREARLNYLEDAVKQMEKPSEKPFKLAGSMSSDLDDKALMELLKNLRKGGDAPRGSGTCDARGGDGFARLDLVFDGTRPPARSRREGVVRAG
jgi:hypothetical protein